MKSAVASTEQTWSSAQSAAAACRPSGNPAPIPFIGAASFSVGLTVDPVGARLDS